MIPNWLRLVKAWRKSHAGGGLTLEFLCAACGMQPRDLLEQVYMRGIPVAYCSRIMAPLIGWRLDGREGFRFDGGVLHHLRFWLNGYPAYRNQEALFDEDKYEILIAYVHAQLSDGTPSRQTRNYWRPGLITEYNAPFTPRDKAFIRKVLGHNPPEIVGVSRTGRIQYAPVVRGGNDRGATPR